MSKKKERGIIFSSEMIQAIIDGRKTQTRRVIKPQPKDAADFFGWILPDYEKIAFGFDGVDSYHRNKYGKVGDLLYVKEAFTSIPTVLHKAGYPTIGEKYIYKFGNEKYASDIKWKSPRFMPKSAARIWLEITDIRVERLHDITSNDIKAEGVSYTVDYYPNLIDLWQNLWVKIKGQNSWDANPWVWVIEFRRVYHEPQ